MSYEIDESANKVAKFNYPDDEYFGDVFNADFTQYKGFDLLLGGSPCTNWSIAQKINRETEAHGIGWELFMQYIRAIKESKPKFFLYENNKSMSKKIKNEITKEFGFEPICINSDTLSAQNRHRYYWIGKLVDDGRYEKVNISQPESKNISINDILDLDEYCISNPIRIPQYGNSNKARPCEALYSNHTGTGYGSIKQRLFSDNKCKQQNDIIAVPISKDSFNSDDLKGNKYNVINGELIFESEKNKINIPDGHYLFRRLSVNEYKKLQTIPENYDMTVLSDTKAYHGIGNGWTIDVIVHILKEMLEK